MIWEKKIEVFPNFCLVVVYVNNIWFLCHRDFNTHTHTHTLQNLICNCKKWILHISTLLICICLFVYLCLTLSVSLILYIYIYIYIYTRNITQLSIYALIFMIVSGPTPIFLSFFLLLSHFLLILLPHIFQSLSVIFLLRNEPTRYQSPIFLSRFDSPPTSIIPSPSPSAFTASLSSAYYIRNNKRLTILH